MSMPVCNKCVTGFRIPGETTGTITKIGNYATYVATPSKGVTDSSKVIINFSDIFGMQQNNKLVADMIAEQSGYTTYLPDLFNGKPLSLGQLHFPTTTKEAESIGFFTKIIDQIKFLMALPWFIRNMPDKKDKDVLFFLESLKQEKGVEKMGAIGFCYGAKFAVDHNITGLLDASVICHPSFTTVDSYKGLKGPMLFNCAETDDMFTNEIREKVKANLDSDSNSPPHDFKVFENCVHGFCARPDYGDPKVKAGFQEATTRSAEWFKKYL